MKTSEIILASVLTSLAGVVFAEGEAAVTDTATVSDTFGIVKIDKSEIAKSEIVVSTPWVATGGQAVTVDKLVTNGLAVGDELSVYDPATGTYKVFRWTTGSAWEGATDSTSGSAPVASETSVTAGMGVWYKPASKEGVFSITGYVKEPTTTLVAGGKKTLIVNPYWGAEEDLLAKLGETPEKGDQIWPLDGSVRYTYNGTAWVYRNESENVTLTKLPLGIGQAFWFNSRGADKTITWRPAPVAGGK